MSPLYHDPIPNASGIYRIVCTSTGKIYIGSSVHLHERQREHWNNLKRGMHPNQLLQHAWNKYGESAFIFEVIELALPTSLLEREQYWLDTLKPFAPDEGYNIARFVQSFRLGVTASLETREKLRTSHIGQSGYWTDKKRSIETIAKISTSKLGKPSPRRPGYTHSPEHREKLRLANLGKKPSEETLRKVREVHKTRIGVPRSPEVKEKIRQAKLGHEVSEETRAKLTTAHSARRKTVVVTFPDGTEHTITGIKAFCREHNLDYRSFIRMLQGKFRQVKGYTAYYLEPDAN